MYICQQRTEAGSSGWRNPRRHSTMVPSEVKTIVGLKSVLLILLLVLVLVLSSTLAKVKPHLIHFADGVPCAAGQFADGAGFWWRLHGFPGWIFREGVGLDGTQWKAFTQRHSEGVQRRGGTKLAETVGGFWGTLRFIGVIQDRMGAPDSHHSSTDSIHHRRRHAD